MVHYNMGKPKKILICQLIVSMLKLSPLIFPRSSYTTRFLVVHSCSFHWLYDASEMNKVWGFPITLLLKLNQLIRLGVTHEKIILHT